MTGQPRAREEGFQPSLFETDGRRRLTPEEWSAELVLQGELRRYVERLVEERDYSLKNARHLAAHVQAAVHESRHETATALVGDPDAVVEAIRAPRLKPTRQKRHQALQEYLTLHPAELSAGAVGASRDAIEDGFAGRSSPDPALVDRDLGGSNKRVRVRMPFSWDDGASMIARAADNAFSAAAAVRDRAIVTPHVRSGLAPSLIALLKWDALVAVLRSSGDPVVTLECMTRHGREPIALHPEAVSALRALWRASGEPLEGPVFRSIGAPSRQLSDGHIRGLVAASVSAAGLRPIDRRHMRAPFGWWLKQRGWDDYHVAHALGFHRVRYLRDLLRPLEEAAAQTEATEMVYLDPVGVEPPEETDDHVAPASRRPSDLVKLDSDS